MRATIAFGASTTLVLGLLALVPIASAEHGPFCQWGDVSCCRINEQGLDRVECIGCVLFPIPGSTAWDTHENVCHFL